MTIKQIKILYGKYGVTHLFTKLDKLDKKEGVWLFLVHNNFGFKIVKRGNISNDDIEYLTVEILRNKDKNIFFPVFTALREVILNFFLDNIKVLVNKFKGPEKQIFLSIFFQYKFFGLFSKHDSP